MDASEQIEQIVLVNQDYYYQIDEAMAGLAKPTIADAISAMLAQGNEPYFKKREYLSPHKVEKPFPPVTPITHDAFHLFARIGHTPEQEQLTPPIYAGYKYGHYLRFFSSGDVDVFKNHSAAEGTSYAANDIAYYCDPSAHSIDATHARNQAIYTAAGMYLREKVDQFYREEMNRLPYAEQRAFAREYASKDHAPDDTPPRQTSNSHGHNVHAAFPYDLIKISADEWRAIAAVATGLREPGETPYCQRLTPIKEALQHAGLFHDMTGTFKNAVARNKTFDREKFKASREKRGAPER